jgi:PadR family transcriptional regulator PadR
MGLLSITEQMYLTAILCIGKDAYGVKIREQVMEFTGKPMVFGTLYNNLDQLVRKGYVVIRKDQSHSDSKKVFYDVTDAGKEALNKSRVLQESLWATLPKKALT